MEIRQGGIADLEPVLMTVRACVIDLGKRGIFQWNENYPTPDIIRADIEEGHLYLLSDGNFCAGIIVLNEKQEDEWRAIRWSADNARPLVVHRLLVHPCAQGNGTGRMLMDFALVFATRNGFDSIRFDVYSGNPRLVETYERMGCVRRGEVFFRFRELPFYCYEKTLA